MSRADVRRSTARELVYLAERLDVGDRGADTRRGGLLRAGVGGDPAPGKRAPPRMRSNAAGKLDLDKAGRVAQQYKKMTRDRERHTFESQYVAFQPSLDGTHVRVSGPPRGGRGGGMPPGTRPQGRATRAGRRSPVPDPGLRRALALTTLCHDQLDNGTAPGARSPDAASPGRNRREPLLMVLARNPVAEGSGFEQGVAVLAGQRVGPDNVDLIRCSGRTELITLAGQDIIHHGSRTSIRPATRRAVLARDDGCTVDGCNSTYRLEVHHIIPVSKGGTHAPENLTTLCWWHHHVAVHRRGMRIDPQSPPQRRRLLPTSRSCGYHPPAPDPHTLAILRALPTNFGRAPP